MNGVKRMCRTGAKIAFSVVLGVGLIGFVKGLLIGYYIGRHKSMSGRNIKCNHKM
jgi:hypothetical protein